MPTPIESPLLPPGTMCLICHGNESCGGCERFSKELTETQPGLEALYTRHGAGTSHIDPIVGGVNICIGKLAPVGTYTPLTLVSAALVGNATEIAALTHPNHHKEGLASTAILLALDEIANNHPEITTLTCHTALGNDAANIAARRLTGQTPIRDPNGMLEYSVEINQLYSQRLHT